MHSQGGNYVKTVFYGLRRAPNISVTGEGGGVGVWGVEGRPSVCLTGLLYAGGAEVEITGPLCGDVMA